MRYLLDASAVLTLLFEEPGSERVAAVLDQSCLALGNLAEVATILARRAIADPAAIIEALGLPLIALNSDVAIHAGLIWPTTRTAGSSLGDRLCLATALALDATILTSDERLAEIAPAVGAMAQMIR